jgi:transposase-like protein
MTLITGGERRRRWSSEERAQILAAIEEPGAVVAEVARRADICTSLVYKSSAPKISDIENSSSRDSPQKFRFSVRGVGHSSPETAPLTG